MGVSYTTLKNISNEYKDYPPGCVPCPDGSTPGNPGTFEDIHKKFENLDPQNFEGARIIIKKTLNKHFNVTHMFSMNTNTKPLINSNNQVSEHQNGYKFGASYTGIKKVGNKEKYPMLFGDIKPNGDLTANFIHTLGCRCRVKLSTQVQKNKYKNLKATMEYRSDDFTWSVALVNPILLKQEGVLVLHLLQAITSRITLGAEIAYNKTAHSVKFYNDKNAISGLTSGSKTNIAGAFRYSTGFRTLSLTIGQAGMRVCYHHKQSQNLQMGVEIQSNLITHESKCRLLYQLDIPTADLVFKGFVDTNYRIGGVFEKRLYPIPEASLVLSSILDHCKQDIRIGIGLNIQ